MNVLFILLRLFLLYLLFRFLFNGIFLLIQLFRNQPKKYGKGHQEAGKKAFDDKDVVDVESREVK